SAVKGDAEILIAPSRDVRDAAGGIVEPSADELEMPGLAAACRLRHDRATGAHRGRTLPHGRSRGRLIDRGHGLWCGAALLHPGFPKARNTLPPSLPPFLPTHQRAP